MDFFKYGEQDTITCGICGRLAVDIHHIEPRGMGGSKNKDNIENLIALCRRCHTDCHNNKHKKEILKLKQKLIMIANISALRLEQEQKEIINTLKQLYKNL